MKTSILENLEKAKFTGEETKSTIEYNLGKDNGYATIVCDCFSTSPPCQEQFKDAYKLESKEL